MILVGVGEAHHDSSICAYINGEIKYAKYERESGIKHGFPPVYWYFDKLKKWGINLDEIDALAYTDFGKTIVTDDGKYRKDRAPHYGENILTNKNLYNGWWHGFVPKSKELYMLDHHYAHFLSNTKTKSSDCGVILDGEGSGGNTQLVMNTSLIEVHRDNYSNMGRFLVELGLALGIKLDPPQCATTDLAGKIMGLQAYGVSDQKLINNLTGFLPYQSDLALLWLESLLSSSGITNENPTNSRDPEFLSLVASIFKASYYGVEKVFQKHDKSNKIHYSGGVALNVNWNRWLLDEGYDLEIEPHVYDGGLSVGCLRFLTEKFGVEANFKNFPYIQDDEAPDTTPTEETYQKVAELLAEGKIVGWYQGHGEIGPRALGNRSILMNPSVKDGKDIINSKVKNREWWRPFGASVKKDKAHEYFDLHDSPYMLYSAQVLKSGLDSITHVDGSCRHQTVTPEQNEIFYKLLDAFEDKTGLPVLLNTSLNLGGKPIAGTMAEAIELFQTTEMDALCLGNHLLLK